MTSLALQVPKGLHADLIGKGGATVKSLQAEHRVSIVIPGRDSGSQEILITGPAPGVTAARAAIDALLGFAAGTELLVTQVYDVGRPEALGAVVGAGGRTLKELQSSFHVSVDVPRDRGSALVTICGAPAQVTACAAKIHALVKGPVSLVSAAGATTAAPATAPPVQLAQYAGTAQVVAEVLFFPDASGAAHARFLALLAAPQHTLDVCVFTLTDDRIKRLLLQHHAHGVRVRVITDNDTSTAQGSDIGDLRAAGIPVRMDRDAAHMHHKFAILDNICVLNGSFNWTMGAAMQNCENIMVTNQAAFIAAFNSEFEKLWAKFA